MILWKRPFKFDTNSFFIAIYSPFNFRQWMIDNPR